MAKHSIGDIVRLKSGGPRMVVYKLEDLEACCIWFPHPEGNPICHSFPYDTIVPAIGPAAQGPGKTSRRNAMALDFSEGSDDDNHGPEAA